MYAGTPVNYTLRLTNTGDTADTFTLSKTDNTRPTDVSKSVEPLASGAGTNMQVLVYVPIETSRGATNVVMVTVTSQDDRTKTDTSTLTILVEVPEPSGFMVFLPVLLKNK